MPITAASLIVEVQAKTAQAQADLQRFSGQLDRTAQGAQKSATGIESVGKSAGNAGRGAQQAGTAIGGLGNTLGGINTKALLATAGIAGVGVGALQTGQQVIRSAIDFESAFAGVRKTVDGTQAEMATLEAGIRQMATSMPLAATEIAGVAEAAGALGVAQGNIMEFTRVASLIGVTTDVSADQAATALGQLGNTLNLTAEDYEAFGSALVQLGNSGASTESDILAITTRIGASAELIGFATEETLGWSSAVANLGMETQAAGGSLQRVFLSTAQIVSEAGDELAIMAETAGMTGDAFAAAFAEDSSAALQTFVAGLGQLDQAQQLATLSALGFEDINVSRMMLGLAGNADNLTDSLANSADGFRENTAMATEAEKRFSTTESSIVLMKNALNDVGITLGSVFLPAIADAAGGLADFATGFSDAVEHLTSEESTLNGLDRWQEAMTEMGTTEVPMPEPPEETGRRWGHFISDMAGHDWGSIWENMRAPDDIMNEFDLPLSEMTDEHIAQLEKIVDSYGDLRPEMGGVTQAQRDQAEQLLLLNERYREWNDLTSQQRDTATDTLHDYADFVVALMLGQSEMSMFLSDLQRGLEDAGPGKMAGLDDLSTDLLAVQNTYQDFSQTIRDEQQAIGEGFTQFGTSSEMAFTQSTASYDRFASAFQGNTEMALSSFDDLTQSISSGAISFEDAASLYAGIPRDVLVPAVSEAAAELRGQLADATLSDEDVRATQGQIESLKVLFPDLVAEIDGMAGAFGNFGAIQDIFQSSISAAGEGVSEWEGHLSGAETALGFLQDKLDEGIPLTAEQQAQYDALSGAVERYTGGIDDESAALIEAEVAKAEFIKRQDELNQALADGTITQQDYDQAISEAASAMDPFTAGQLGAAEATMEAIDKIRDFMVELGLIEPPEPVELEVDRADAIAALDDYADKIGETPQPDPTVPSVDDGQAHGQMDRYQQRIADGFGNPQTTTVTADVSSALSSVELLFSRILGGATMPVTLSVSGGGAGITEFADGGISEGGLALVGEEGPEFVVLPKGAEVIPNPETMAMMAGMPWLGGFADGTITGVAKTQPKEPDPDAAIISQAIGATFEDVGFQIGRELMLGVGMAIEAGIISDVAPSAGSAAQAIIDGMVDPVKSEIEGVDDWWEINTARIPELASMVGNDIAVALLEEYGKLQGELQLAILAGEDVTELNTRLAAIDALFVEWGMSVVGTVDGVAAALEDIADAERVTEIFQDILGDLEGLASGEAGTRLGEELAELLSLERIAEQAGEFDLAAHYAEQAAAKAEELRLAGELFATPIVQGMTDALEAEQIAAAWDQKLGDALSGPSFGADIEAAIAGLDDTITLGILKGAPMDVIEGWQADKAELEAQAEQYWRDIATGAVAGLYDEETLAAYAEAGGAQFEALLEGMVGENAAAEMIGGITQITDAGFEQLMTIFGQGEEMSGQFVDDVVAGLGDGTFDYEQAMALLGQVGSDALLPMLEDIERQLTVDLVNAIVAGNAELEADILEKLELLGLLQDELGAASDAALTYSQKMNAGIQQAGQPYIPNGMEGSSGGSGGGGGGSSRGGSGGTWIGGSGGSSGGGGFSGGGSGLPGSVNFDEDYVAGLTYPELSGMGALPQGDQRVPGGWGGGVTPSGIMTANDDGVFVFKDAIDHYTQTGDPYLMGKYAFSEYSGAMGSHGGDIAGYMEGLMDPNRGREKGNALIMGLAGFFTSHPHLWDDDRFWAGFMDGVTNFSVPGVPDLGLGYGPGHGSLKGVINTIMGLTHSAMMGDTYLNEQTGLVTYGLGGHAPDADPSTYMQNRPAYHQKQREMTAALAGVSVEEYEEAMGMGGIGRQSKSMGMRSRPAGGIRAFADGGIIDHPLLAMVGEAGTEMVQPLSANHPERAQFIANIAETVLRSIGQGNASATFVVDGNVFQEVVGKRVMHMATTKAGV